MEVWVRMQSSAETRGEAAEALRHIGTNALPYLLKWIRYETPSWKVKLYDGVKPILVNIGSAWQLNDEAELVLADGAARAIRRLGSEAEGAIPDLTRLMREPKANASAVRAMYALAGIGKAGLPPLMAVLSDKRARFRGEAAESIGFMGPKDARTIVLLLERANDGHEDKEVASKAHIALETLKLPPALLAVINCQDTRANARFMASLLGNSYTAGKLDATLASWLTDTDFEMRQIATNALRAIDPWALEANGR